MPETSSQPERRWPEVELAIDVLDDPPRPFFAEVLDETPGSNWREDDEYRTETYVPASTLKKEKAEREAVEALLGPAEQAKTLIAMHRGQDGLEPFVGDDGEQYSPATDRECALLASAVQAERRAEAAEQKLATLIERIDPVELPVTLQALNPQLKVTLATLKDQDHVDEEACEREPWKQQLDAAMETAQEQGVPLSALHEHLDGVVGCGGSGERDALDDTLAANNEAEPCPGCPDCTTGKKRAQVDEAECSADAWKRIRQMEAEGVFEDQPDTGINLTSAELEALAGKDGYIFEPPDECEHGFSPPSRCPNEGCPDQHVASAWFKFRAALNAAQPTTGETPEADHFTRCGGEEGAPTFYGRDSEADLAGEDGYCRGCSDCNPDSSERKEER